jgi:hypothetical protein
MNETRWQDAVLLLLGMWLVCSPFFLDYGMPGDAARWNSFFFGLSVSVVAICALIRPAKWVEWVNLVLGLWLIAAPLALQFDRPATVKVWNHVVPGALVAVAAAWALLRSMSGRARPDDRR